MKRSHILPAVVSVGFGAEYRVPARRPRLVPLALVAFALVGCGGDETNVLAMTCTAPETAAGGSCAPGDGSAASSAAQLACVECSLMQACNRTQLANVFGSLSKCVERFTLFHAGDVSAPGTTETAEMLQACATALVGQRCEDYLIGARPSACIPPPGPRPGGSSCGTSGQCASSFCYRPFLRQLSAMCGTCETPARAGELCISRPCVSGTTCKEQQCVSIHGLGGECESSSDCLPTLQCNSGACATRHCEGMTCTGLGQGSCDTVLGLECNPAGDQTRECRSPEPGLYCSGIGDATERCPPLSHCHHPCDTCGGECMRNAEDGAACGDPGALTQPISCTFPAECRADGFCGLFDPSTCM